jgi:hypoxanthine phosphoribosyltransferase
MMHAMGQGDLSVLVTAEAIQSRVRELAVEIDGWGNGVHELHVVGVLKGGVIRALSRPVTIDFVAMSSYGQDTKPSSEPRLIKSLDEGIEDRDVLVVEDIVDTGCTLSWLLKYIETRRPRSLRSVALLDKPARRQVDVRVDLVGFRIQDHFVVGYGLDFAERYRHLPYLGVLEPSGTRTEDDAFVTTLDAE